MSQRTWSQTDTEHLEIFTDLKRDQLGPLAAELEGHFQRLQTVLFNREVPGLPRTRVILYHDRKAFIKGTGQDNAAGFFTWSLPAEFDRQPTLILYVGPSMRSTFIHEVTHRMLAHSIIDVPSWMHEGMASYYEGMAEMPGKTRLGELPPDRGLTQGTEFRLVKQGKGFKVLSPVGQLRLPSELLSYDHAKFMRLFEDETVRQRALNIELNYVSAWAFVHFLLNGPEEYASLFAQALAEASSKGLRFPDAFKAAFADVDKNAFDERFSQYINSKELRAWEYDENPLKIPTPQAREVPWGDRVALDISLSAKSRRARERAVTELIRLKDNNQDTITSNVTLGNFMLISGEFDAARENFLQCQRKDDDNPRCMAGLLRVYYLTHISDEDHDGEPEVEFDPATTALLERFHQVATTQGEHLLRAELELAAGRPAMGKLAAIDSLEVTPDCSECLSTLAATEFALGNAADAVKWQEWSISLMGERVDREKLRASSEKLRLYREVLKAKRETSSTPASTSASD